VAAADAVEIEVGANDVGYSNSCGTSPNCYMADVPQVEKNLTMIVARVHALAAGKPVLVVLLDFGAFGWAGRTRPNGARRTSPRPAS
jgi:hypothetical protein